MQSSSRNRRASRPLSCTHYQRRCSIVAPCCGKLVCCHRGHDESRACEVSLERTRSRITEVVCNNCNSKQEVRGQCRYCRVLFGRYFCRICVMYHAGPGFHCVHCSYCVAGKRSETRHCFTCGKCYPLTSFHHTCASRSVVNGNCPVCHRSMYASRQRLYTTRCRHTMHERCFLERVMVNLNCPAPNCRHPIADEVECRRALETFSRRSQQHILVRIKCNTCGSSGQARFASGSAQCNMCGSSNTSIQLPSLNASNASSQRNR